MLDEYIFTLNRFFRERFGERVQRIPLDIGARCPHLEDGGCIYCYKGSKAPLPYMNLPLREQIAEGVKWARRRARLFFAYAQAYSATYVEIDVLKQFFCELEKYPEIVGVVMGTRPDCVSYEILRVIDDMRGDREIWIEYGLQSAHYRTLMWLNRQHTLADFISAVMQTAEFGFLIGAHLIVGLPGETVEEMIETVRVVCSLPVKLLKFHSLYVQKGTKLAQMYEQGEFFLPSMMEYVNMLVSVVQYVRKDVVIARLMGECPPDELIAPGWVLDKQGFFKAFESRLKELNAYQGKALEV